MRLARPVYEGLPYVYVAVGMAAILVSYLDAAGTRSEVAFAIGLISAIAGVTLCLHRHDSRTLRNQYPRETGELRF
jgi:hypothetical protein